MRQLCSITRPTKVVSIQNVKMMVAGINLQPLTKVLPRCFSQSSPNIRKNRLLSVVPPYFLPSLKFFLYRAPPRTITSISRTWKEQSISKCVEVQQVTMTYHTCHLKIKGKHSEINKYEQMWKGKEKNSKSRYKKEHIRWHGNFYN